jgi:hypothetical protein
MITLTKHTVPAALWVEIQQRHVWPLKVVATASAGVDPKIFVYHSEVGQDPYQGDTFECVASVPQLSEIPEDAPATLEGRLIPYYRKDVCEFNCRSAEELAEVWAVIQTSTENLVTNLKAFALIQPEETVVYE